MLSAFAEESTVVNVEMIQDVIGDLDFENYYWMAASDEHNILASGSPLVNEVNREATPDLQDMLADISRRIESIEQNISIQQQTAQKDQNDRFSSFEDAITSHVVKTNALVLDFGRKLEELRNFINSPEPCESDKKLKTDFDWRIFGGDISPGRK
jgi:hypothetical protein